VTINNTLNQQPQVQPKKTIAISQEDGNKLKATETLFDMLASRVSDTAIVEFIETNPIKIDACSSQLLRAGSNNKTLSAIAKQINVDNLLKWLCGYKPEQNLKIIKSVLTELKSVLTELKSYSTQDLDNWLQDVTKKKIISTLGLKKQSGDVPPDNFDEEKVYDENDPIAEEQLVLNEVSLAVSLQLQDGSVQSKFGCHRLRQSETDNWMPPEAEEFSMLDRYEMDAFMIGDKTLL